MSMISQFYSYVMLQDDTAGTPAVSILVSKMTWIFIEGEKTMRSGIIAPKLR